MGRDIFFNTGMEKRFVFGIQSSSDIRLFGGVIPPPKTLDDARDSYYKHAWSAEKDHEYILNELKRYTDTLPDFTSFPTSLTGTWKLSHWLDDNQRKLYSDLHDTFFTFQLGCIIYHQLMYMPELYAKYE